MIIDGERERERERDEEEDEKTLKEGRSRTKRQQKKNIQTKDKQLKSMGSENVCFIGKNKN